MSIETTLYCLLGIIAALIAALCWLAHLLGRERAATAYLRWELLGANLLRRVGVDEPKEDEWPTEIG
jgi:hypothetical protein